MANVVKHRKRSRLKILFMAQIYKAYKLSRV